MKENSGETLGKIVNLRALAIIIVVIGLYYIHINGDCTVLYIM